MISRAVRVPRICLACRFGLITQRSAGLGFRTNPVREGLGRRLYTSDIGKLGDSKVEPLISNTDTSETNSEERLGENESTTTIPFTVAIGLNKSDPATEIDLESTPTSQEKPIGFARTELDDILDGASPPKGNAEYGHSELSSKQLSDFSDHELDDLLNEAKPETPSPSNSSDKVSGPLDLPQLYTIPEHGFDVGEFPDGMAPPIIEPQFRISELPDLDDGLSGNSQGSRQWPKRRLRDDLMHEEPLGVPSLGLPADAIIINNPNKTRIERSPVVIEEEEVAPANIDWESLNPSEIIEPEVEEINANIEEFRPDTRILRLTEIGTLVESLCDGFTINQLRDYHRDCVPEQEEGEIVNYTWIEASVPWKSVNSVRVRGTDKTAIAQKIVFDKWRVDVMEYENDLGKAYVWMDPDIFPFLLYNSDGPNNTSRLLWMLRRDFLVGEDEKLTLTIQASRLNITARKSTTYGVLAYMDQYLQGMRSRTIYVSPYLPTGASNLKPAELKELGRLTKTSIKRVREGEKQKYRVSWLPDSDETPAGTEDIADMVFRLMVGLTVPGTHDVLQRIPLKGEDEVGGQFVSVRRQTRAMSWRDKLGRWFRVADPVTKSSCSTKESSPLDLASSADLPEWKIPGTKDITTATFGHVLHSEPQDSMKLLSRQRHILLPFIPHPAAFSALKPDDNGILKESTTIIMNLVPREERKRGRTSDAQKGVKEPAVRIRIPVNPDADFANFCLPDDLTVEYFASWHVNDLLLPTEAVDVRLQHERVGPLSLNNHDIQKFLKALQFNLAEGKIRTPAQATLNIPGNWLDGARTGSTLGKKKEVLYDFRGTEIHKTVEMSWRNHTLRYSSIEAGQQGGQRQEITLKTGLPGVGPVKFSPQVRQNFLQLVEDMVTGKCFSWHDGDKSIKSRQLEDYSYDLPEQELTDDIIVKDIFDAKGRPKSVKRAAKKQVLADEGAAKASVPENSDSTTNTVDASRAQKAEPTNSKKSAAATERDRVRTEIMNNFFVVEETKTEPSTTSKKKPSAARKAKVTARKYTVPDLEQPKKTKAVQVDPFLAQFTSRVTSDNKVTDPNATPGFFDSLPSEKKPKTSNKTKNSGKSGSKRKGGKK
ncbi:hypothetical protein FSST1_009113 [Fusarium sambucinum]